MFGVLFSFDLVALVRVVLLEETVLTEAVHVRDYELVELENYTVVTWDGKIVRGHFVLIQIDV